MIDCKLMLMLNESWLNKKAILRREMFVISLTRAENMISLQKNIYFHHNFFMIRQIYAHGLRQQKIPLYCFNLKLNYSFICFGVKLWVGLRARKNPTRVSIKKWFCNELKHLCGLNVCSTSRSLVYSLSLAHLYTSIQSPTWKCIFSEIKNRA